MRQRLLPLVAVFVFLSAVSASALPGLSNVTMAPVKCSPDDITPDGRVFPEPRFSATFLSLGDFECGIGVLAEVHPDLVEVTTIGESSSGHPIYNIKVTDESIPEHDKRHLLIINSIHGNEHAGREGAARVIEDMVDPSLRGAEELITQTLQQFVVHFVFANPDGWVNGQLTGAPDAGFNFTRGNNGGRDLNRNFPVQGYLRASNGTLDQPESRALDQLLQQHADTEHDTDDPGYRGWYLGTDNHGQNVKPVAASGLQIVGQFDFRKSERLARFADSIEGHMEGLALDAIKTLSDATGEAIAPYEWGTLYDILGYSAAGSGIDYYNTPGLIEGTGFATEMTASNLPFSNILTHPGEVNQMWVDTTRAINYAMFATAVDPQSYTFRVAERTAYVFDPVRTTSEDVDGFGENWGQGYDPDEVPADFTGDDGAEDTFAYTPYSVSRMDFFDELTEFADRPLDAVSVPDVLAGTVELSDYDALVLADEVLPEPADRGDWVGALDAFVRGGGNLIVTDGALQVIPDLIDGVAPGDVSEVFADVGYADFVEGHALNEGLRGVASQTYDVIPIGYPDNAGAAPNWLITQEAVTGNGGSVAGTHGSGGAVYGQFDHGQGQIHFLGALLPEPTEEYFHPYGLQDYAVTYTGYTLLENMLAAG